MTYKICEWNKKNKRKWNVKSVSALWKVVFKPQTKFPLQAFNQKVNGFSDVHLSFPGIYLYRKPETNPGFINSVRNYLKSFQWNNINNQMGSDAET